MSTQYITLKQRGDFYSRGDFGEQVTELVRVTWNPEENRYVPATPDDPSYDGYPGDCWAAWDDCHGWQAPWTPEAERTA